jgi:RNA polymerase sigma-70 factor, ECF subfamily
MSLFRLLFGHTQQMEASTTSPALDRFSEHRPYLLSLAYRMLGSMADAEDLVQETYIRWQQASPAEVRSPRAFLTTVLTRLALNYLDSARVRREQYVGPWLPEPILTTAVRDPAELSESLTMAFLILLESLSPLERITFLLHEVFDYSHSEIADITGSTEAASRQAFRRAKAAIAERRPRFHPQPNAAERLTQTFLNAMQQGKVEDLLALLHPEVVTYSDGGGQVHAAMNPIYGPDRVARFLVGIARKGGQGLISIPSEVNGQPAFIGLLDGKLRTVLVLDIEQDRIRNVYIVVNPDKLQHLAKEKQSWNLA